MLSRVFLSSEPFPFIFSLLALHTSWLVLLYAEFGSLAFSGLQWVGINHLGGVPDVLI